MSLTKAMVRIRRGRQVVVDQMKAKLFRTSLLDNHLIEDVSTSRTLGTDQR